MKKIIFGWIILLGALITSCSKDLGNYVYDESLEDVKVIVDKTFSLRKEKRDFVITPKFEMKGDESDLSFLWLMNSDSNQRRGDTVSVSKTLTISIDPDDPDFKYVYYIRFYVTDNRTNATALYPIQVNIGKPYENSWMVMHTVDGHAEIGSVEYVGDQVIITPDAYTKENGRSLTGKPVTLGSKPSKIIYPSYWGYDAVSEFYIATTNSEESGLINQADHLKLFRNWEKLIHPAQLPDLNINDISIRGICDSGLIFISNGKVFRGSYVPIIGEMSATNEFEGDYYISKAFAGPHVGLGYDKIGHRFVHLQMQSESWYSAKMPDTPMELKDIMPILNSPGNAANPNNIESDRTILNILGGYQYLKSGIAIWQRYAFYAYALSNISDKSYIYVFHAYAMTRSNAEGDMAAMPSVFTINTPKGIDENTLMAASPSFNNILFYAIGNKVYKLDFGVANGLSTLIYQHPDPDAQIVSLKMAIEGNTSTYNTEERIEAYGHDFTRSLGVGVNLPDNKGQLIILNLNTSGKVGVDGKFPAIQIHEGFGSIKDVVFI